jgi:hypothetical protein
MFSGEIADSRFKSALRCEDGEWGAFSLPSLSILEPQTASCWSCASAPSPSRGFLA